MCMYHDMSGGELGETQFGWGLTKARIGFIFGIRTCCIDIVVAIDVFFVVLIVVVVDWLFLGYHGVGLLRQ